MELLKEGRPRGLLSVSKHSVGVWNTNTVLVFEKVLPPGHGGEGWLRPWQLIGYQRYACDPRVCSTGQLLPSALRRCKLVVEQRVAAYRPLKGIPSKYY